MSSEGDTAIQVQGLSKAYRIAHEPDKPSTLAEALLQRIRHPFRRATQETFWALRDVSFRIDRGEVVGIIGRNGAGKSTLLKILSRITEPTAGQVDLYGRVGSLLEVGTGFHPELTGRENIFLNGAILGMTKAEIRRQFDAIVDFAGVATFLDTPVKRYSSGMYVRLAFAVAAHLRVDILIVDEILAVGDTQFQKKCLDKMQEIAQGGGRTVLFVSHQMDAIQALCQRCVYLQNGTVGGIGPTTAMIEKYVATSRSGTEEGRWNQGVPDPGKRVSIVGFKVAGPENSLLIETGKPCAFIMDIHAREPVGQLRIAFGIDDKHGRRLTTFDSNKYYASFDVRPGPGRFVCALDSLPLKPDVYRVHLYVGDDYGAYDYVDGDAEFEVASSHVYPSPKTDESHGPLYLAQRWKSEAVE